MVMTRIDEADEIDEMDEIEGLDWIIEKVRERGRFAWFRRYDYTTQTIERELRVLEAIGKMRSPKFVIDEDNRFAYTNFIKWLRGDPTMQALDPNTGEVIQGDLTRGLYIAGNTGSGKSWCLEIMQEYAQVLRLPIEFSGEDDAKPLIWNACRADEICREWAESGDIQKYKTRPILAIQDFGQEPQETLYMGNRLNVLRQLIEYRGDQDGQLTLITSNLKLSGKKLEERYSDRVQSRLFEMCNYFEIKGADRRKAH